LLDPAERPLARRLHQVVRLVGGAGEPAGKPPQARQQGNQLGVNRLVYHSRLTAKAACVPTDLKRASKVIIPASGRISAASAIRRETRILGE
jgi:hypothetical protein